MLNSGDGDDGDGDGDGDDNHGVVFYYRVQVEKEIVIFRGNETIVGKERGDGERSCADDIGNAYR